MEADNFKWTAGWNCPSKEIAFVRMKTMNCCIRECSITDGKQWPLVGEGIFFKYYQFCQSLKLRSCLYHSTPGLQVQQVAESEPVAEGGCVYFLFLVLTMYSSLTPSYLPPRHTYVPRFLHTILPFLSTLIFDCVIC